MKKLIMTDLDCTLLPMDQDAYINKYVNEVAKLFYERGFDGKEIAKATMKASYAMLKNDGSKTNRDAFEEAFRALVTERADEAVEIFPEVYGERYNSIKDVASFNPFAKEIASLMREKARFIVIATQPMFPIEAVEKRLSWTGLSASLFDYCTVYDTSTFSKPSTGYYQEIMDRFSAKASETVMIGNDVNEDILPCEKLGVETFLLKDGLINTQDYDIKNLRQGNYPDLTQYLKAL